VRLIPFLVIVVGGGLLIGATNLPGAWYAGLAKPSFTPPAWLFAPAWTILYVLMAIAGWRTFQRSPRSLAMGFWYVHGTQFRLVTRHVYAARYCAGAGRNRCHVDCDHRFYLRAMAA
jgi:tryptophan-rich sensory protein